jgi:predicted small lipoprotein YifL
VTHLRLTRSATACLAVVLIALCCAGCGRRGRLDLPPDDTATAAPAPVGADGQAKPVREKRTKQVPPPKDFILDPLI